MASTPPYQRVDLLPGRVRLRIPRVAADERYAQRLLAQVHALPAVTSARLSRPAASLVAHFDAATSAEAVEEQLRRAMGHAASASPPAPAQPAGAIATSASTRLRLAVAMGGVAALARLLGVAVPLPLAAAAVVAGSVPIARRALRSIVAERRLSIDVLDMTAITLMTLRGSFVAPATMIGLVEVGEAIRERTARASRRELGSLVESMGTKVAWVERDGARQQVAIGEVRRGDAVIVYPGDRIPVDGRVLAGHGVIDEHQLTGEALPVVREEGQLVYASTLMRDGHLHIAVEQTGAETRAGRILQLMRDAPVHDTRIENYAATLADRAVLPSLLLSALVFALTRDAARAASILITDFTTGIRVSVPTTVLAAVTRAAQLGILIRSGRALEQLARVDAVVFDKTGTLTRGEPLVTEVRSLRDDMTDLDVLRLAASAEQRLTHPVAEAVMRYAGERGVTPGRRTNWGYRIGLGVRATVDGETVLVGSERLLEHEGVDLTRRPDAGDHAPAGGSRVFVAHGRKLVGVMAYADPVRAEGKAVIASLRALDMEIHLLTGDRAAAASAVARELHVDLANTHAELFPEQKAAVVQRLHGDGKRVAFVGDGINDLPALAYADVSISFGGATDVARETADVVLMNDDLRDLATAIAIARQAVTLIRQNIAIVAGSNLGALALATSVGLGPVPAAVVHNGSTVAAALNGLRPLSRRGDRR